MANRPSKGLVRAPKPFTSTKNTSSSSVANGRHKKFRHQAADQENVNTAVDESTKSSTSVLPISTARNRPHLPLSVIQTTGVKYSAHSSSDNPSTVKPHYSRPSGSHSVTRSSRVKSQQAPPSHQPSFSNPVNHTSKPDQPSEESEPFKVDPQSLTEILGPPVTPVGGTRATFQPSHSVPGRWRIPPHHRGSMYSSTNSKANKVTDEKKPNEAQILFDRLIQSTIKSTRTRAGMREKGNVGMEAVRVNLERQLNEDINSITTPRKTASHLNCSHGNLTKRNQTEVVNFYEVEEEMMGIDWKPRTTVEDRCTDPVAKLLDKYFFVPIK